MITDMFKNSSKRVVIGLGAAWLMFAPAANVNAAPPVMPVATGAAAEKYCQPPVQVDPNKTYSRKEAYRASGKKNLRTSEVYNPRIVLHYGEGIDSIEVNDDARALTLRGYDAAAMPGGPDNGIELFVVGGHANKKRIYTAEDLRTSVVSGVGWRIFTSLIKRNKAFGCSSRPVLASLSR